jgi:hypothetical protein
MRQIHTAIGTVVVSKSAVKRKRSNIKTSSKVIVKEHTTSMIIDLDFIQSKIKIRIYSITHHSEGELELD